MDTLDGKTNKHLANTDTQGGDALDGKTNKHRHKGGDAPYGKTYKHLATTESHRVGTHWTERLTIFWQFFDSRPGCGKNNSISCLDNSISCKKFGPKTFLLGHTNL